MKNKSAGFYSSSLEMLLDTMCNMLGGVVFIALMVAVVAQDSTPPTPVNHHEQTVQLSNQLAAVISSNAVMESSLEMILKQLQDPRHRPETNVMHLPNVAKTAKQPWLVIMQYGKVYPLDVFSSDANSVPVLNQRKVLYQAQSRYIEPRPGQGEDPQTGMTQMVENFKTAGKTNYYFAFLVYNDSFDAFARARDTAVKFGFQYGWNPLPENQRIQAGAQGERVLPQN